jgi:hypothetical protein
MFRLQEQSPGPPFRNLCCQHETPHSAVIDAAVTQGFPRSVILPGLFAMGWRASPALQAAQLVVTRPGSPCKAVYLQVKWGPQASAATGSLHRKLLLNCSHQRSHLVLRNPAPVDQDQIPALLELDRIRRRGRSLHRVKGAAFRCIPAGPNLGVPCVGTPVERLPALRFGSVGQTRRRPRALKRLPHPPRRHRFRQVRLSRRTNPAAAAQRQTPRKQ